MASTRLVLPWPLRPMNAVAPGSSSTSRSAYERKLCRVRCATCTCLLALSCFAPGAGAGLLGLGRLLGRTLLARDVPAEWRSGLHGVPTELVAHRGDRLHGRR